MGTIIYACNCGQKWSVKITVKRES